MSAIAVILHQSVVRAVRNVVQWIVSREPENQHTSPRVFTGYDRINDLSKLLLGHRFVEFLIELSHSTIEYKEQTQR